MRGEKRKRARGETALNSLANPDLANLLARLVGK